MERWRLLRKGADFEQITKSFSIDEVTARLIRNRDVQGMEEIEAYLHADLDDLYDPFLLKGTKEAVAILKREIADGALVRVIGDYDIDGVMASYILVKAISDLGGRVDLRIPDRIRDGYGVNEELIRNAYEDGVSTVLTCDNGISANAAVDAAKELGMRMIITDHHQVVELPDADAVIDPKQPDCPYPYKELCGASVAWKLVTALGCPDAVQYLPYAAFATIGDIVELRGENRIIAKEGIRALRKTKNTGLLKLLSACSLTPESIDPFTIGFVLGPCFNAGGRLDKADLGYRLLTTTDPFEAETLALRLKGLNEKRKEMTEEAVRKAEVYLKESGTKEDRIYLIPLEDCHESIAGIVAGRIREKYDHPTFVLVKTENGWKGSGRSVEAYSMVDGLVSGKELLLKFGGHPMAAGLTLPFENLEDLRKHLNAECALSPDELSPVVTIDLECPPSYFTEDLLREFELLAPFGKGNERPLFACRKATASSVRTLGEKGNVLSLRLTEPGGAGTNAILFRFEPEMKEILTSGDAFDLVYYPSLNTYRGRSRVQIVITHLRPSY